MIVSIASGKGGTGKTTVALLLAAARPGATLVDCDVEEPNCHLFLQPVGNGEQPVTVMQPVFDAGLCNGCGKCATICLFNALAITAGKPLLFAELCHSCGGCIAACPQGAAAEAAKEIGLIRTGTASRTSPDTRLIDGLLHVGVPTAGPLIKAMKKRLPAGDVIIDCPPGTACSMVTAVAGSDYCLLVTEPTPFGLHDLRLAAGVVGLLGIPAGVVINKSDGGAGDAAVADWCAREHLAVLARIPHSDTFAREYAEGRVCAAYQDIAASVWASLGQEVTAIEGTCDSKR